MKKVFSLLIVLSIILGTVNVYAAEPTIYWFGDATNDYTEGFESFDPYAAPTGVLEGKVVAANNGQRLITGEKYLEAEPSRNFGYATKTEITDGIADISFGMRIRSSADGSISFTEKGIDITNEDHINDNVFQIRTNGANIDLYVNDQKKAQLTTKNQLDGNKMSSIMKIHAAYDFGNKNLRVKADLYDTAGSSVIETQTVDVKLDDSVTSLCGMQIISKANYTGLAFDDLKVIKSNETNIDNIIPAPAKPTQQPDRITYVSDNFDSLSQNDGSYIVQMPGNTSTAKSVENSDGSITFYAEGRKNGSSDYKTGIKVGTNGSDKFVTGVSGNYANGGRHTYMTFNNVPAFTDMGGKALSMEFDMKMTTTSADMSFNDGTNKAFAFKISNNMLAVSNGGSWVEIPDTAKDTWYDVKVIANRQSGMYTLLISKDNRVIYTNTLSYQGTPSTISRIDFSKDVANAGDVASLNNIEIYCGKTAPIINNVSGAKFGNDLVFTFDDDSEWREAVSTVYVNGEPIENNETGYSIAEGSLTIDSTVLEKAGAYTITVSAADYSDIIISQIVTADITNTVTFEKITVNEGTRLEDVMAQFTKEYEFTLEDGETLKAQLSWSQTSTPEYDMLVAGDYVFEASIDGLPEYATIPEGYEVNQTVAVNVPENINIESANVIEPLSYNVSNNIATVGDIIVKLPTRASITLAGGAVYEADVTWVCDGKENSESAVEGTYSFTANYQNLPSYIKNPNQIYPKVQVNMVTAAAVRVSESLITDNSLPSAIFASSFGNDNLVTYNGYQYAVYYTAEQHPAISRRVVDSDDWETIVFTDYTRTAKEDGHYVIVMGICAEDGTIHMAWDGWNSPLKYRISAKGIANDPQNAVWSAESFSGVLDDLNGLDLPTDRNENYGFGYPRFLMIPTTGKLQFETRLGYSGNSDNWLFEYDTDGWETVGKIAYGTVGEPTNEYTNTFYIHGIDYDNNGRMHITWSWRERARTGITDLETCHDLNYVYSDDYGRTFYNSEGEHIATATENPITQKTEGIIVKEIPRKSGIVNQEGQAVDSEGRIHVVVRHYEETAPGQFTGNTYRMHYWRDHDGTWYGNKIVETNVWNRAKIFFDSEDRAYYIYDNAYIYTATPQTGWSDWTLLSAEDKGKVGAEPLIDKYALKTSDKLYIFAPNCAGSGTLSAIRYDLNFGKTINDIKPVSVTGESKDTYNAQYVSDDNYMTRWEADTTNNQQIEFTFDGEQTIDTVVMREAFSRITGYTISYKNDGEWVTVMTGDNVGPLKSVTFNSVTTDKIKISFETDGDNCASLFDIKAYNTGDKADITPEAQPNIQIDYKSETLTGFIAGSKYTINGIEIIPETEIISAVDYIGKTLSIVKKGDGETTIDSVAQSLEVPARTGAPENVTAVGESISGGNDGKITGVDSTMEYKLSSSDEWTRVTGTEITNLVPGTYTVRYAAGDVAFASESVNVVVEVCAETKEELTVLGDFKNILSVEKITSGEIVQIKVTAKEGEELPEVICYTATYSEDSVLENVIENQGAKDAQGNITITLDGQNISTDKTSKIMLWADGQNPLIEAI